MKTITLHRDEIYTGNLILVNKHHPHRANIKNKPLEYGESNILLDRQLQTTYSKVLDEINANGKIITVSGFRTEQEQEQIYQNSLQENGEEFTSKYVALPGHSEHQTGLAVDVALNETDIDFIRPKFPSSGICEAFRAKANYFGLIERYPKNKEDITGIAYEPWHFRYVGAPHSIIMKTTGDTLEEYHERLKNYRYGENPLEFEFGNSSIEISYLGANSSQNCENAQLTSRNEVEVNGNSNGNQISEPSNNCVTFSIENDVIYTVSGNNVDGFIITKWRR